MLNKTAVYKDSYYWVDNQSFYFSCTHSNMWSLQPPYSIHQIKVLCKWEVAKIMHLDAILIFMSQPNKFLLYLISKYISFAISWSMVVIMQHLLYSSKMGTDLTKAAKDRGNLQGLPAAASLPPKEASPDNCDTHEDLPSEEESQLYWDSSNIVYCFFWLY